jgi:hypothetical protein
MIEPCPECGVKILVWANEAKVGRFVQAQCPQCKAEWTCDLLAPRSFSASTRLEKYDYRPREVDLAEGDIEDPDIAALYNKMIEREDAVHFEFEKGILEDDLSNRYYTTYGISSNQTDYNELKKLYIECGDGIKHDFDRHAARHQFTKGLEPTEKIIKRTPKNKRKK